MNSFGICRHDSLAELAGKIHLDMVALFVYTMSAILEGPGRRYLAHAFPH